MMIMRKRTFSSHNKIFGCPHFWGHMGWFRSPSAYAQTFLSLTLQTSGLWKGLAGARLAELKAAGNVECVSGDTH